MFRPIAADNELCTQLRRIRGDHTSPPAVSVIFPVNARADLDTVLAPLSDVAAYAGRHAVEVVLVVNNYPPEAPPEEHLARYRAMGATVVATPNCRRPGALPSISARAVGLEAATAEATIHLDADVRIPNATRLIDWYVEQFQRGAAAAYTHVGYFDLDDDLSVRFRLLVHNASRWGKRNLLGIPTLRGSNYAVRRTPMLRLWNEGRLVDELNVGPTFQRRVGRVAYSGARELVVFTSGRYWQGGWGQLLGYFYYRLRVNIRHVYARGSRPRP